VTKGMDKDPDRLEANTKCKTTETSRRGMRKGSRNSAGVGWRVKPSRGGGEVEQKKKRGKREEKMKSCFKADHSEEAIDSKGRRENAGA